MSPTASLPPGGAHCSTRRPFAGAETVISDFSVWTSTRSCSAATASPGATSQATTVASAEDSPSWGTRIDKRMGHSAV